MTPKRYSKYLFCAVFFTAVIFAAGCGETNPKLEQEAVLESPPVKVEVFAARGELHGTLYEKYVLSGSSLWRECGTLTKKPTVKINPAETQADIVEELALKKMVESVVKVLGYERKIPLPPPDSPFGIASGGAFEMAVTEDDKVTKFTTSVDAVSGAKNPQLKAMNRVFSSMRAVGQKICGGGTFFGM